MSNTATPKVILITGCSSGFGLHIAARLSSQNHHVIATMRNMSKQNALLNEVGKRDGKVTILELDVTKSKTINNVIHEIKLKHGIVDVLVNNAGYALGGAFEDLTEQEIRDQMDTNLFGVQNVTRAVIPLMRNNNNGKIINISSTAGFSASPGLSAYNASKWALEGFSESLRYEMNFFGIDVLLIEPGVYNTPIFHDNARYGKNCNDPESPYYPLSAHLKSRLDQMIETCRKDPEDIAVMVERLINSKHSSFRNIPDASSQIQYLIRKFMPLSFYSWLVNKTFSLKNVKL